MRPRVFCWYCCSSTWNRRQQRSSGLSIGASRKVPWAGRHWALPVLTVLAPSARYYQERGRRHKKLNCAAGSLVAGRIASLYPDRQNAWSASAEGRTTTLAESCSLSSPRESRHDSPPNEGKPPVRIRLVRMDPADHAAGGTCWANSASSLSTSGKVGN